LIYCNESCTIVTECSNDTQHDHVDTQNSGTCMCQLNHFIFDGSSEFIKPIQVRISTPPNSVHVQVRIV